MINRNGAIVNAYKDTCTNYKPDTNRPTVVRSVSLGMLFKCENYDPISSVEIVGDVCPNCKNEDYQSSMVQ